MGKVKDVYDRPYSPEAAAKLINESRRMMQMAQCTKCPQMFLTEWPRFCSRKDCPQRRVAKLLGYDPDILELLGDDEQRERLQPEPAGGELPRRPREGI